MRMAAYLAAGLNGFRQHCTLFLKRQDRRTKRKADLNLGGSSDADDGDVVLVVVLVVLVVVGDRRSST